ncbi:MAG: large subunit ribosomal protein, partial [Candidatus Hydrogenedentes bacterium]|nr:large subunit ribosomal protein [Candidatus Hydrogenedentota bacterium]
MAARLGQKYRETISAEMRGEFNYSNVMQVPRLEKVVVNIGVGEAPREPKAMENAMAELAAITGQRGSIRKARKSIAGFKLREGTPIGCMVTLRGD